MPNKVNLSGLHVDMLTGELSQRGERGTSEINPVQYIDQFHRLVAQQSQDRLNFLSVDRLVDTEMDDEAPSIVHWSNLAPTLQMPDTDVSRIFFILQCSCSETYP